MRIDTFSCRLNMFGIKTYSKKKKRKKGKMDAFYRRHHTYTLIILLFCSQSHDDEPH